MSTINEYLYKYLLPVLKAYPTAVQETILKIIEDRLGITYSDIINFSDTILDPKSDRYDIVKAKASQYDFNINKLSPVNEQIKLLNSINDIYSLRGSVDSIENMWKYYGGDLPKNVKVSIPSYDIFRYSVSKLSGTHRFQDSQYYRPGIYNITIDDEYNLDDIRDFIIKELVAAGTNIIFNKQMFSILDDEAGLYRDTIYEDTLIKRESYVNLTHTGLTWSVLSISDTWSGLPDIFVDIRRLYYLTLVEISNIIPLDLELIPILSKEVRLVSYDNFYELDILYINNLLSCTEKDKNLKLSVHYYDENKEEILPNENYPGYFILAETNLGEVIIRNES